MKIELKRITYNARLSEETAAFAADVWIDGKKAGEVSNDGHGGPDRFHPWKMEETINAYAKTLPKHPLDLGGGKIEMMDESAEGIVARLLDNYLETKRLTRLLKSNVLVLDDCKGFRVWHWKGVKKITPEHIAKFKAQNPQYAGNIVNEWTPEQIAAHLAATA